MSEELDAARAAMEKAVDALDHDFATLRTGRPSAALLDEVKVD